jgi:hypothetical protein
MLLTKELAENDIINRTKNYEGLRNLLTLNNKFIDKSILIEHIINKLNSTNDIYYDTIDAPDNININNSVKGPRYKYLYETIKNIDIILIWHNKERSKYEFWATSKKKLNKSMRIIKSRINNAIKYHSS